MLVEPRCILCGRRGAPVCVRCETRLAAAPSLALPLDLDACVALFHYEGAAPVVTALKNAGRRDLLGWLAPLLAARIDPPPGTVVTWAPTGPARRLARGFDHAELLARAVARRWERRAVPLLRREPGPPQAGHTAVDRRSNPSFRARRPAPASVILVDDVVTTGATLTAAARTLRRAGAATVTALVVARAPQRRAA